MLSPASVCTPGVGVGTSHVSWVRSHSRVPHDIRSGDSLCYWHLVVITGDRFKLVQFSTVQGPPCFIMRHVRLISWWLASYWNAVLLPPANEVWGKVIFLHLSLWVILFKVEGVSASGSRGVSASGLGVYTSLDTHTTPGYTLAGRDGHWSGRYASYWNAFLFLITLVMQVGKWTVACEHFRL